MSISGFDHRISSVWVNGGRWKIGVVPGLSNHCMVIVKSIAAFPKPFNSAVSSIQQLE